MYSMRNFEQPPRTTARCHPWQPRHHPIRAVDQQPSYPKDQARQPSCWDPPWLRQTTAYQYSSSYEADFYLLPPPKRRPTCWDPPEQRTNRYCSPPYIGADMSPDSYVQPQNPYARYSSWPNEYQTTCRLSQPSQHGSARQPSCWDPPSARLSMGSWAYEEECESDEYDDYNEYWDFDEYDEDSPYSSRDSYVQQRCSDPYRHKHNAHSNAQPLRKEKHRPLSLLSSSSCRSTPHFRHAAACLEQPTAVQQPLTTPLPTAAVVPPYAADPRRLSSPYPRHDPSSGSLPTVAAVPSLNPPPPASSCSPTVDSEEEGVLFNNDPPPPAVISPPCSPVKSEEEETLLDDEEEVEGTLLEDEEEDDSIEEVKKVASFKIALMTSQIVVGNCWSKKRGAYTDLQAIACVSMDLNGGVTSRGRRSTLLDADARLIPPSNDTPCLSFIGRVDKLFVLALNCCVHKGLPSVIWDGVDEGRRSTIWLVFDPGGDVSPKLMLSPRFLASWFPP